MQMASTPTVPRQLSDVFGGTRHAMVAAAVFSGIINILMLTGSLYMMQVYDRVLTSRSIPTLVALSVLTAALFAFSGLLEFVRTRLMVRVARIADAALRGPVFDRLIELGGRKTAATGTQPLRDVEAIRQYLASPAPFTLFDMPWMLLYVAVCWVLHPWLGYLALGSAVLLLAVAAASDLASRIGAKAMTESTVKAHVLAEEALGAGEAIRAMGMQSTFGARWRTSSDEAANLNSRAADRASIFSAISKVLRLILQSAALGLGAYLAIKGEITPGVIIGATILIGRALAPIDQAIGHWRHFSTYRQSRTRLATFLADYKPEDDRMTLPAPRGDLSAEGLIIFAPGSQAPLIQGVTFSVKGGAGLGIVGPTGAGKSTLARALVGAWPAVKGAVRLDGARLEQWPANQLGRAIGYLPQEISLLSGTIMDNIARFDSKPDHEAVVTAARRANLHDVIVKLPDGYNTKLGADGGIQLSGGQRQRIALARALYGNPMLLVLDEPNSNLDGDGETALFAAIQDARLRGATVVVIAHRPSAIRAVDHLLYIKDGRQVAFGPKEEVLAKIQGERRPAPGLAVVGT